jgi:hypothetical protein
MADIRYKTWTEDIVPLGAFNDARPWGQMARHLQSIGTMCYGAAINPNLYLYDLSTTPTPDDGDYVAGDNWHEQQIKFMLQLYLVLRGILQDQPFSYDAKNWYLGRVGTDGYAIPQNYAPPSGFYSLISPTDALAYFAGGPIPEAIDGRAKWKAFIDTLRDMMDAMTFVFADTTIYDVLVTTATTTYSGSWSGYDLPSASAPAPIEEYVTAIDRFGRGTTLAQRAEEIIPDVPTITSTFAPSLTGTYSTQVKMSSGEVLAGYDMNMIYPLYKSMSFGGGQISCRINQRGVGYYAWQPNSDGFGGRFRADYVDNLTGLYSVNQASETNWAKGGKQTVSKVTIARSGTWGSGATKTVSVYVGSSIVDSFTITSSSAPITIDPGDYLTVAVPSAIVLEGEYEADEADVFEFRFLASTEAYKLNDAITGSTYADSPVPESDIIYDRRGYYLSSLSAITGKTKSYGEKWTTALPGSASIRIVIA